MTSLFSSVGPPCLLIPLPRSNDLSVFPQHLLTVCNITYLWACPLFKVFWFPWFGAPFNVLFYVSHRFTTFTANTEVWRPQGREQYVSNLLWWRTCFWISVVHGSTCGPIEHNQHAAYVHMYFIMSSTTLELFYTWSLRWICWSCSWQRAITLASAHSQFFVLISSQLGLPGCR